MTNLRGKILAVVLILLNLAVSVAPHIDHTDKDITFAPNAELRSHTCGANEIHKSIKDHSDCLLCSRTTHFVAFVVGGLFGVADDVPFIVSLPDETSFHHGFSSLLYLRGPPTILS